MEDSLSERKVTIKVQRYDPETVDAPHWQEFTVPARRGTTVLDGLIYIKENLDSTLAFRTSCRMGVCGSCAVIINNFPHLACHTQIEEFRSGHLAVKPLNNHPLIKDLVVDLSPMFQNHKAMKPYIMRQDAEEMKAPTREYRQTSAELDVFEQFSYCIKCGICVAACPTSASDVKFAGPQALAQCYHYNADTRDDGKAERFEVASSDHGVWRCHLAGACSESCPKGVDPALAIQLLKRLLTAGALGMGKKRPPAKVVSEPKQTKPPIAYPEIKKG
jgi:succinate dehydrogenase / fumarate reductase iron-sulfur subunit